MSDDRDLPPLPIPAPHGQMADSFRRHSTRSKDKGSIREMALLLNDERRGHHDTQRELERVREQLRLQTQLTQDAESRVLEATSRLKAECRSGRPKTNRLTAVREAARLNESLRLYRFQLETAQNEINRAQSVFNIVEKERYKAELAGAKSRTVARRLHEQQKIYNAREEGRRQGLQEGLEAGRLHVLTSEVDGISNFADLDLLDDELYGDDLNAGGSELEDAFYSPNPSRNATSIRDTRISQVPEASSRTAAQRLSRVSATPDPVPVPSAGWNTGADSGPLTHPAACDHPAIHNQPPHPLHQHADIPPDGYIPTVGPGPDSLPEIPPAHEFIRRSVILEEPAVSPAAFARALSPRTQRPVSVTAEAVRAAPSAAGSIRSVKMPTPRSGTNLRDIELEARRTSTNFEFFPVNASRSSSGSVGISVLPASPESRPVSQMYVGSPSSGNKLFGRMDAMRNHYNAPVAPTSYVATGFTADPSSNHRSPDSESTPSTLTTPPELRNRTW
ncbi:hypothetical protein C8F01DRAFT_1104395 [Mycena amicta]|nr:hypothetical protein C8F01DRAFT_1104395 [Mycena amicta]